MRTKVAAILLILLVVLVAGSSVALGKSNSSGFQAANGVSATPFPVNPHRFDPYKNFKFGVKWDGQNIDGIFRVTGLIRSTEPIDEREGLDPNIDRISPGLTRYEPIVIKRGITQDRAFEQWANLVWEYGQGAGNEVKLSSYRKDVIVDLYNEAGQKVMSWVVYRAWPSEYVALEVLDANKGDIAVESITLQHEGWQRDLGVTEPTEP
jgi:phage tail-like protein